MKTAISKFVVYTNRSETRRSVTQKVANFSLYIGRLILLFTLSFVILQLVNGEAISSVLYPFIGGGILLTLIGQALNPAYRHL